MDIRKVKKLIELLEESGIAEIEIKEGEEAVRISRMPTGGFMTHMQQPMMQAPVATIAAPVAAPSAAGAAPAAPRNTPFPRRVRRPAQPPNAPLRRLATASATVWEGGDPIDEVNG